jgi:hypothetical protein
LRQQRRNQQENASEDFTHNLSQLKAYI